MLEVARFRSEYLLAWFLLSIIFVLLLLSPVIVLRLIIDIYSALGDTAYPITTRTS